ncbi:MAG: hypothetical protein F4Y28_06140 [Acidimicrobiia bacterium]|nr:hypothetical protein [Acidimicrobiia bacterium]MYG58814.1 hypothetical protein [Acidimicrobiia bacterium]MYJ33538.1 hypothetical protein [Acidimicrobiia bacterium]
MTTDQNHFWTERSGEDGDWDSFRGAEDAEDRRELAAVLAEDDFVPWEDVKAELGLCDLPQGVSPDLPWDEVKAELGLE